MALTKAHSRMIDGSALNVRDYGAVGDGSTNDTVAIQAALDALSSGQTLYFPDGTYVVHAPSTATELDYNNYADGLNNHIALELKSNISNVNLRGENATLKLVSTNLAGDLSWIMGNKSTTTVANLKIEGLTFDVDKTGNVSAEDARGLLVIGCSNLKVTNCKFYSSSAKGGYSMSTYNCDGVDITNNLFTNISGGYQSIYTNNTNITGNSFRGFNEAIDFDKACIGAVVSGNIFYGGSTATGQAVDINGSYQIAVTGNKVRNTGTGTISINGKLNSDTFANHKTGASKVWWTPQNITISGNAFRECANSATIAFLTCGNNWVSDSDRSGAGSTGASPFGIVFSANDCRNVGQISLSEGEGIVIDGNSFTGMTTPTGASNRWAILAYTQNDWTTYPDAQTYSRMFITVTNNSFQNSTGGVFSAEYADSVKFDGNYINNTSTSNNCAAVRFENLDKRGTQGSASSNTIDDCYDGLRLQTTTNANGSKIKVKGNRITNASNNSFDLSGVSSFIDEVVEAEQASVFVGTVTAASMNVEKSLLHAATDCYAYQILCSTNTDVTQSDTDYVTFNFRKRTQDGATDSAIVSPNTKVTGGIDINDFAVTDLTGLITDADAKLVRVDEGQSITCLFSKTGTGQDLDELLMTIRYIER